MASNILAGPEELLAGIVVLQHRVDALEKRLAAEVPTSVTTSSLAALLPELNQITQDLFPGPVSCTDESDPEYPNDTYVVINVESTGEPADIVRRRCQWHERIRALSAELFGKLRLSIVPR